LAEPKPLVLSFFFRGDKIREEMSMILIGSFVGLLIIGEGVNVAIALLVERFSEAASLAVFFGLLLVMIIAAWNVAVRLTEPTRVHGRRGSS
jgi:hypothetical protein